jgi:branched-chain amino acid transport system substrate-binding protein
MVHRIAQGAVANWSCFRGGLAASIVVGRDLRLMMFLKYAVWVLLALAGTSGWPMSATAQSVLKIGVINSYSGFLAQAGDEMGKGIDLYAKDHEKDLPSGVKVELIRRDDAAAPEIGKRVAQELITRDHVQLLIGVISSPVAAAIAPLTAEGKVPFIITNAAGVAIPRLSPYLVRVSFTQWHTAYPLGKWTAQQGWKKGFTAVSDFIPGHDAEAAFIKSFTDAGGQIVGTVRFPTANLDFAPFVQRIKDAKPDVAFLWVPAGQQATAMLKAVKDSGLREAGIKIVATQDLVPDEELPRMGNSAIGVISAGTYSAAAMRPANQAFLVTWNREYPQAIPDCYSIGGWDGMAAAFEVIKQTGGKFTAEEAMQILGNWKSDDSPRGPIMIDPATRDIIQDIYIRRTEIKDGKLANIEFETIKAVKDPWKELNPLN